MKNFQTKIKFSNLTKLLLCTVLFSTLFGCDNTNYVKDTSGAGGISIEEIDSCEYVLYQGYYQGAIIHKQNCKFCLQRSTK